MERRFSPIWLFGLLTAVLLAAALRLPDLNDRPMHTDEAVHALKLEALWQTGRYQYDPHEFHGPTLYYLTLPVLWAGEYGSFAEFREATLRIVPALAGVAMVLLLAALRDGLGSTATVVAGLLLALSTAFVFYARYYIQETPLACFSLLLIVAGWRYACRPRLGWVLLGGVAVGLMHATKETALISWGCALLAATLVAWRARQPSSTAPAAALPARVSALHALAFLLSAAVVSIAFFSVFFTYARGPLDSLRAYLTYFERAGSAGVHVHPTWFYLRILAFVHDAPGPWWSEGFVLVLAAIGIAAAFRGAPIGSAALQRFLAFYALLMTAAYALISYKTPWCLLEFHLPLLLLAGCGAARLLQGDRWRRATAALVLAAGCVHLLAQARDASTRFAADQRNPYVYGHSLRGVVDLADWVLKLSRVSPDGARVLVRVFGDDPWPLPWYLRALERVGYWPADAPPDAYDAPVVIVDEVLAEQVQPQLRKGYQETTYAIRPGLKMRVLVQTDLYHQFAMSQARVAPVPSRAIPHSGAASAPSAP